MTIVCSVFCPKCGEYDCTADDREIYDTECNDAEFGVEKHKEHWTCDRCGHDFWILAEYRMVSYFVMTGEDPEPEDIYDIAK